MRSFMAARRGCAPRWSKRAFLVSREQAAARANAELSTPNLVLALSVGYSRAATGSNASPAAQSCPQAPKLRFLVSYDR
jgi:hypothetical protein